MFFFLRGLLGKENGLNLALFIVIDIYIFELQLFSIKAMPRTELRTALVKSEAFFVYLFVTKQTLKMQLHNSKIIIFQLTN